MILDTQFVSSMHDSFFGALANGRRRLATTGAGSSFCFTLANLAAQALPGLPIRYSHYAPQGLDRPEFAKGSASAPSLPMSLNATVESPQISHGESYYLI